MSTPSYEPSDQQAPGQHPDQHPGHPDQHGAPGRTPQRPAEPLSGTVLLRPDQQRLWSTLAHLSPVVAGLLTTATGGFLWTGALGPLIIFLVLKDRGPFVREQALEALNFQIVPTIVYVVGFVLGMVTLGLGFLVTVPIIALVGIVTLVFQIIAAVRANQGIAYRYPLSWRLVR